MTADHIDTAARIARDFGATRVVLFGSAVDHPAHARDLDLAVAGVHGWAFYKLGARLDRTLGVPVDLVALDPPTPFSRRIEGAGRVLYDGHIG
ncbi:nucleotidyltransferase domain-containing protein [Rubrivirga sp. S365]|uniref:Nucleotidyltransferase domain-containing protein n=1 Tax=Rubrivirga litoralis TaxID=3075598 RepID=A0ABU3BP60_9BACT|nr:MULTISPECIES: nucleotidyltransferase domain-containing protein [unclassified Rubrivirga]MDT0631084.1 nucleotidyltransferase domain-containing protein [Rubrivirga sp. F394]MDT7855403.1 nucleotidyltransferase domain-containing protein [Rubrivirga sp. S365]